MIFKVIPEEKQAASEEKRCRLGKYFVNHSFSGFENKLCVTSTESTVLVRSGYSFVAVEVKV